MRPTGCIDTIDLVVGVDLSTNDRRIEFCDRVVDQTRDYFFTTMRPQKRTHYLTKLLVLFRLRRVRGFKFPTIRFGRRSRGFRRHGSHQENAVNVNAGRWSEENQFRHITRPIISRP